MWELWRGYGRTCNSRSSTGVPGRGSTCVIPNKKQSCRALYRMSGVPIMHRSVSNIHFSLLRQYSIGEVGLTFALCKLPPWITGIMFPSGEGNACSLCWEWGSRFSSSFRHANLCKTDGDKMLMSVSKLNVAACSFHWSLTKWAGAIIYDSANAGG